MKRISMIVMMLGMLTSGLFGQGKIIMHNPIYWGSYYMPADGSFNWNGITHYILFGSFLRDNASINYLQFNNTGGTAYLNAIIAEAHANNVKVLMCVAGDNYDGFFAATTDSAHCQTVVDAIMTTYYDPFNFDGVDLDWEGSFPADKWMLLSRIFRTALNARGGLLMADIGRGPSASQPIWFINQFYDNVQPMVYDNNGWYSYSSGFHNPLGNPRLDYPAISPYDVDIAYGTATGIQALQAFEAQGIDKSKLTPGIAFYPHVWHDFTPGIYQPGMPTRKGDPNGSICNGGCEGLDNWTTAIYPKLLAGWTENWAPNANMAWIGDQATGYYANYNNAQSFAAWNAYLTLNGWGGAMLFDLSHQHFNTAVEWPIGSGLYTKDPLWDDFRASLTPSAPSITTQPSSVTKYVGDVATFSVSATAVPQYQWQKNSVNISGATSSSYTTPTLVLGDNASTFRCIVSNSIGTVTSNAATLTVLDAAPVVTTQPASVTVAQGNTATFTVATSGSLPKTYQWHKSSSGPTFTPISGAISASYTTPATGLVDDQSMFRCVVSNAKGAVTSATATLTVVPAVSPTSDDFSTGELNAVWVQTNTASASTFGFSGAGTVDALFSISIPSGTSYDAFNFPITAPRIMQPCSDIPFGLETRLQLPGTLPSTNWQSMGILIRGTNNHYVRYLLAVDEYGYHIYTGTSAGGEPNVVSSINIANTNNNIYLRIIRSGNSWTPSYSFDNSTWNEGASFTFTMVVDSVGLHVANAPNGTAPATSCVFDYFANLASPPSPEDPTGLTPGPPTITVQPMHTTVNEGSSAVFTVGATTAAGTLAYQWTRNGVNIAAAISNGYGTPPTVFATDNQTYFQCIVSTEYGTTSSNIAILTVRIPASITVQPVDVDADSGTQALFSVTATGTGTLAYQWQKNTVNITGENQPTLALFAVQPSDSNSTYRCIVSNDAATVTSNSATLRVFKTQPNILSINPTSVTVQEGTQATFFILITGKSPYFVQWQKNGVNIAGATSTVYTTPATVLGDSGDVYRCYAFSGYGSDTSGNAILSVVAEPDSGTAPIIVLQPQDVSVYVGQKATFKVIASGSPPMTFEWATDWISGGGSGGVFIPPIIDSSLYVTNSTILSVDGSYFECVVSNAFGTVTSNQAILTVLALPETTQSTINITYPDSTADLFAGSQSYVGVDLLDGAQVTVALLPSGLILSTWPERLIGGGIINTPFGLNPVVIPYDVPFDSGSHQIRVYDNTGLSDTSQTFHIKFPQSPSIIFSTLIDIPGVAGKKIFGYSTNIAGSVVVTWRRLDEIVYHSAANARNIKPNVLPDPTNGTLAVWPYGQPPLVVRFTVEKDGLTNYREEIIDPNRIPTR